MNYTSLGGSLCNGIICLKISFISSTVSEFSVATIFVSKMSLPTLCYEYSILYFFVY